MLSRLPREWWLVATIVLLIVSIHAIETRGHLLYQSQFLGPANLTGLIKQIAMLGIFALGAGIIIIAGGIDLSSGSVICFAGIICASIPSWVGHPAGEPYSTGLIAFMFASTMSAGLAIGILHGLLVTKLDLPPFVATLGTMAALRSLASLITTGSLPMSDPVIRSLGREWYAPVIIFAVLAILLGIMMHGTRPGRYLYALGGNEEAARLSALPTNRLKILAYVIGSLTATLAGLAYLGDSGGADSRVGQGYELSAIAAAVIGGCNLKGGAGSIVGIVLGVILLRVVVNGTLFVIEQGATEWEGLIVGIVVILAVLLGRLGRR